MLVRHMAWRLEQRVGDGGATAVLLLRALVDEGLRQVTAAQRHAFDPGRAPGREWSRPLCAPRLCPSTTNAGWPKWPAP